MRFSIATIVLFATAIPAFAAPIELSGSEIVDTGKALVSSAKGALTNSGEGTASTSSGEESLAKLCSRGLAPCGLCGAKEIKLPKALDDTMDEHMEAIGEIPASLQSYAINWFGMSDDLAQLQMKIGGTKAYSQLQRELTLFTKTAWTTMDLNWQGRITGKPATDIGALVAQIKTTQPATLDTIEASSQFTTLFNDIRTQMQATGLEKASNPRKFMLNSGSLSNL